MQKQCLETVPTTFVIGTQCTRPKRKGHVFAEATAANKWASQAPSHQGAPEI